MSSGTKQGVLRFPVRKTRSSSRSKGEPLLSLDSPRRRTVHSPTRKHLSPQRNEFILIKNDLVSPRKNGLISIKKNDLISLKKNGLISPHKNIYSPKKNGLISPKKNGLVPPKKKNFSPKVKDIISARKNDLLSPKKNVLLSPRRGDSISNNIAIQNPSKFGLTTPSKSVNVSSLLKISRPLDFDSPVRRSPRKLEFQNSDLRFDSPVRRSPRKIDFQNSPSTMISQLSVGSPKRTGATIGLHRAELKAYQSLKTSLARNCNNRIVGRETEINFLQDFIFEHLKNSQAGSLYVSGAPGTGKTVSVTNIVDALNDIPFKKVWLNCMSKKSSKEIFTSVAESLNLNVGHTEREIIQQIEKALTTSKVPIIMILDEVDQLESKDQKILYTLFEWPSLAKSKLVLIGIANMLDLTDRILPRLQAVQSCRPQLLHFPPYTKTEIIYIINERIKEADIGDVQIIKPSAIHFLAGKISSVVGDVRRALDVCRRAVEVCEIQTRKQMRLVHKSPSKSPRKNAPAGVKQVDIPQIMKIFNDIYGSKVMTEITDNPNTFPLQQKILICSLLLILNHSKTKNASLGKFHEVYSRVCKRQKLPGIEQSEFFSLCTLLESRGMLQVKKSKELRNSKIFLRLNPEEAELALGDKGLLLTILEDKESLGKSKL